MIPEIPLQVAPPLGHDENDDFSLFQGIFDVEKPYGVDRTGNTSTLSHSLSISIDPGEPGIRLFAILRSRIRYVAATNTDPARIELQPLPFEGFAFGERLLGSPLFASLWYEHVDHNSVEDAVDAQLMNSSLPHSEIQTLRSEFLSGDRWMTVDSGTVLGHASADPSLNDRHRVDFICKDSNDFFVNPNHYFVRLPDIDESLKGHPLLTTLSAQHHGYRFPTMSTQRFVKKDNPGAQSPYETEATAAGTIGDAMNAAEKGDTVYVLDSSVYTEEVEVKEGVSLVSGEGAASVVTGRSIGRINMDNSNVPSINNPDEALDDYPTVRMRSNSHLSGFAVEKANNTDADDIGGGVTIENQMDVEICRCLIRENSSLGGGGITVQNSNNIRIEDNVIYNNASDTNYVIPRNRLGWGGGIFLFQGRNTEIRNNWIHSNTATSFGGGVGMKDSRRPLLISNKIGGDSDEGNKILKDCMSFEDSVALDIAQGGGGGIGIFGEEAEIVDCEVRNNEAHAGGGIEFYAQASGLVEKCIISENTTRPEIDYLGRAPVGGDGGGIALNNTSMIEASADKHKTVTIKDCEISGNRAGDDGGGVYGTAKPLYKLEGNIIKNNVAVNNGGGFRVTFGGQVITKQNKIQQNEANTGGGSNGGGGVAMRNSMIDSEEDIITDNTSNGFAGGGVYVITAELLELQGVIFEILLGQYRFEHANYTFNNCQISNNTASGDRGAGGGLYATYNKYDLILHIFKTTITQNTSEDDETEKKHDIVVAHGAEGMEDTLFNSGDRGLPQESGGNLVNPQLTPLEEYTYIFKP